MAEDSTEAPLEVLRASPPAESEASHDTGRRTADDDEEGSAAPAGETDWLSSTLSRSRCSLHGDVPTDTLSRIASRQEEVRSWLSRSLAAVEVATSPIPCSNLLREAHELRARKQALEAVLAARETLPTSNEHKASAVRVDELRLKYNTVKKEKLQKEQELHALHAELEDLRAQAETHQAQVEEVQRTRDALAASLQFLEERPVEMDVYLNVGTRGRPTEASLTMAATRDGSERYQAELKLALVDVDRKCAELGHYVETMDHIRRRVVAQTHEVKCEVSRIKDEIAKAAGEKTALFIQLRDLQRQTNLSRGEATQFALVEKEKGKLLCQRAQLAISELHSSAGTTSSLTKFETIFKLLGLSDVPLEDRIERIVSMVNDPESSIRRYRDEAMLRKEGLVTQLKLLTDSLQVES
ncbi:hypothetical protein AB1Y20_003702 [Prymnesium parvum]|uniref:Uncharacterized protein n=1 Tax=Prymnesium parvum TaxID=97485 RepID=A0AB34J7K6_PRYPA